MHFKDTIKFTQTIEKSITYFKHFYQTRTSLIYRIQQRNIIKLLILTLFLTTNRCDKYELSNYLMLQVLFAKKAINIK